MEEMARGNAPAPAAEDILVRVGDITAKSAKSVGAEELSLNAAKEIGLPGMLAELGVKPAVAKLIQAQIVARMVRPASERGTLKWLRDGSALGDLMGIDFRKANDMTLHRAADALWELGGGLDALLTRALAPYRDRRGVFLYDLTNFHLEGVADGNAKARRGHSKAKRDDCKLLTLAVTVNEEGYIVDWRTLPGNISEPSTLQEMLDAVRPGPCDTVMTDKGIATKANLELLNSAGVRFVVASREMKMEYEPRRAVRFETDAGSACHAYRTVDAEAGLARIRIRTEARMKRDLDIIEKRLGKFEAEIGRMDRGLDRPGTRKDICRVLERIGALKKECRAGRYFETEVIPRPGDGSKAGRIIWRRLEIPGSKAECPGVSCIMTNDLSLETKEAVRLYNSLVNVESAFRRVKTELGGRPVFHSSERRADTHIHISCLAYQIVNYMRLKLRKRGIHDSWETVRTALENRRMVVLLAKANKADADVLLQLCTEPSKDVEAYYNALMPGGSPKFPKIKVFPGGRRNGLLAA
jgi:hypothetical protein